MRTSKRTEEEKIYFHKLALQRYYQKNKEKFREKSLDFYYKHKEPYLERSKQTYLKYKKALAIVEEMEENSQKIEEKIEKA